MTRRFLKVRKKRKMYINGYSLGALHEKWFSFLNRYSMENNPVLDSSKPDMSLAYPYEPVRVKALTGVEKKMPAPSGGSERG